MTIEAFDEVVAAARAGGEWAWRILYRSVTPAVLGYLRGRGVRDPDDLAGEVFIHVVRGLASFEGDERAWRAWVLTVAHHRLIDDLRRRSRTIDEPAPFEEIAAYAGIGDVEEDALGRLSDNRAVELLARLTPDQQDVLLLRIVGELSLQETARAIGKRVGAVKALQRRALAALRREISKEGVSP